MLQKNVERLMFFYFLLKILIISWDNVGYLTYHPKDLTLICTLGVLDLASTITFIIFCYDCYKTSQLYKVLIDIEVTQHYFV